MVSDILQEVVALIAKPTTIACNNDFSIFMLYIFDVVGLDGRRWGKGWVGRAFWGCMSCGLAGFLGQAYGKFRFMGLF